MKKTMLLPVAPQAATVAELEESGALSGLLDDCDLVFVKKLSLNDRDWARLPNKHQAGIYIPERIRDGGFFPALKTMKRDDPQAKEIREAYFDVDWPDTAKPQRARLVHYTSKGAETHLTGLPKSEFRDLAPASLVVIGRHSKEGYLAFTLDSEGFEYEHFRDFLSLSHDFTYDLFSIAEVKRRRETATITFIEEVVKAYFDGTVAHLVKKYGTLPTTLELATMARGRYMQERGLTSFSPFDLGKR
jgi:hypothetical protein